MSYRGLSAHGDLQRNATPDTLRQIDIIPAALSQFRFQVRWRTLRAVGPYLRRAGWPVGGWFVIHRRSGVLALQMLVMVPPE